MATSGLYNFRVSHRDRHSSRPDEHASATGGEADAALELLTSLRGVQPERLRSLFTDGSMPASRGLSLRVAFADLPNKLLRRERPTPSSVRRPI